MNEPPPPSASNSPDAAFPPTRLARGEPAYPPELDDLGDDAPSHLWVRGSLDVLAVRPRIAIVGTRRATPYGQRVTRELATAFVRAGACVVSGLATGIDGSAHHAALEQGGTTVAVLGTGLNVTFPRAHRALQAAIARDGLLLSELDHDDHGKRFTFPRRNRIIAALASMTIVVEAGEKSGALGTAAHAFAINRIVAAVPGAIDQPQSVGANKLIADSAHILTSIEDALALAGLTPPPRTHRGDPAGAEGRVWAALANGALDMDSLCHRSGLPAAQCMAAVTTLEIAGSIECSLTGEIRRR